MNNPVSTQELRRSFTEIPCSSQEPPEGTWEHHRWMMHRHVMDDDPLHFLRWSTVHATMFVGEAPHIRGEYDELMGDHRDWRKVITEPRFGAPWYLSYAPWTSGNLVHQAFHLKQWLDISKIDITKLNTIQEIGGGYGAMSLVTHRLGFRGEYQIHDLPEFSLLQQYYLSNVDIPIHTGLDNADLFIALFSMSEMSDLEERWQILTTAPAKSYLIGYQPRWKSVNNHDFFLGFAEDHPDLQWSTHHNPNYPNHHYLIGK